MPSDRPEGAKRPDSHTVYIEDALWERVREVAFRSKPRRSASDVLRELISRELPNLEQGKNGEHHD